MRKVKRYLEYVNFREETIEHKEITAYEFEAKTKDGADIELFVYRDPRNPGDWMVNVGMGANALASVKRYSRRKDAVNDTKRLMLTITGSRVFELVRIAKKKKEGFEIINEELTKQ